jgi:hypothetical protein
MINSYHCLCTPGADSKVFFESRNEDVRLIMKEKVNKMFLQLKACKITNPEYSREIDQFMDDVENDVKSGRSFSHAISNASFSYEIRYEKKKSFLLILKRGTDGTLSIRSCQEA